jgi:ubiquinone/menaquinone biosynthesis C-methylase UbiE
MSHCQCEVIERRFDTERVRRELAAYRRHGAASATRLLIEALQAESIEGMTLLDIGGGIGAILHALVPAGVSHARDVDLSAAYLAAAREEAERLGLAERMHFVHGNFVELASAIPPADLVTLDRVICCFHDMPALVSLSAARAQKLYGVVIPRDTWYRRLVNRVGNVLLAIANHPIHFYVYRADAIDAVAHAQGLERWFSGRVDRWQVTIYIRSSCYSTRERCHNPQRL